MNEFTGWSTTVDDSLAVISIGLVFLKAWTQPTRPPKRNNQAEPRLLQKDKGGTQYVSTSSRWVSRLAWCICRECRYSSSGYGLRPPRSDIMMQSFNQQHYWFSTVPSYTIPWNWVKVWLVALEPHCSRCQWHVTKPALRELEGVHVENILRDTDLHKRVFAYDNFCGTSYELDRLKAIP